MAQSATPPWFVDSPDPETTHVLAALLGRSIGARGLAIGLVGPLGSGKTAFVKGLAEGLGLDPDRVSSPTFVLAQQYALPEGPERLHHLDFYRLVSEAELEAIGFLDLLGPGEVLAVEWLDRFPDALGPERLEIVFLAREALDETGDGAASDGRVSRRRMRVTAFGDEATRVVRDWSERFARFERARSRGEGAVPATDFDWRSLLALLFAGGLGLELAVGSGAFEGAGLAGGATGARSGCAALAPEDASGDRVAARDDGLGALRVRCLDRAPAGEASPLEGMARLLDGGTIDPNDAPRRLLESLPGIGPGRAAAIEAERARARFRSVGELERVPGIGPKTRAGLEAFLAVDSEGSAG